MDIKDSSEDEEAQNISAFSQFDESIEVRNAEEIKSPVNTAMSTLKRSPKNTGSHSSLKIGVGSLRGNLSPPQPSRYSNKLTDHVEPTSFGKSSALMNDASDSEETDDDDIQGGTTKGFETYDPKEFEDLHVSAEIKELFENITRFSPQKIDLDYKLIPFVPDYIPAVGDIDAFIKVPKPDGTADKVGLVVLDEPCANQSEPAVLHLQLRSHSTSSGPVKQAVIKRIDDPEKNSKSIEKWINDMNQLHTNRHPLTVHLSKPTVDIDTLMQQWSADVDERLENTSVELSQLDCDLPRLVDIACTLVDIPVYPDARMEALHTMFTLFLEIRDHQY
ncbi:intraflagellar transport protein 46 homolog [Neodiprion pinetum]|uniref:Intraflagellar transport protein 46 homolog n=1 Tax=Neodiprion lecontei TaxID=441921 RepID=A0A6J0C0L9_NEOLC|nr:intraflagellar transport protein 46 homolog [Neodiprion lecontei]XP_046476480.1 intraflagellar transport protein 46 homolog [Neodiprion pinetum]